MFKIKFKSFKNLVEKYEARFLYWEDGSPCYFRISCLSLGAFCLLLSVFFKSPHVTEYVDPALQLDQNIVIIQANNVSTNSGATNIDFSPFAAAAAAQKVGSNGEILSDGHNAAMYRVQQQGVAAREAMSSIAAVSTQQKDGKDGTISTDDIAQNGSTADEDEEEEDLWTLWGFFTGENDKRKARFAIRKQALSELSQGAAFLTSCGNLNAGFVGCNFDFSETVSASYTSRIEAADDGFSITLEAKGEQRQDSCTRFIVNSEGVYKAFDVHGFERSKCMSATGFNKNVAALHHAVDGVKGKPAPSGARLAQK